MGSWRLGWTRHGGACLVWSDMVLLGLARQGRWAWTGFRKEGFPVGAGGEEHEQCQRDDAHDRQGDAGESVDEERAAEGDEVDRLRG